MHQWRSKCADTLERKEIITPEEKKDLNKYDCRLCKKDCQNLYNYLQHCNSDGHKAKQKLVPSCQLCNTTCNTYAQLLAHEGGTGHKKKLAGLKTQEDTKRSSRSNGSIKGRAFSGSCGLCHVPLPSLQHLHDHLKGVKHLKMCEKKGRYPCFLCNRPDCGPSGYAEHLNSDKHKKRHGVQ